MTQAQKVKTKFLFHDEFKFWLYQNKHLQQQLNNIFHQTFEGNITFSEDPAIDDMDEQLWNQYAEILEDLFTFYKHAHININATIGRIVYAKEYHQLEELNKKVSNYIALLQPQSKKDTPSELLVWLRYIEFITEKKEHLYDQTVLQLINEGFSPKRIELRIMWLGLLHGL